jgi:hypothetical protein
MWRAQNDSAQHGPGRGVFYTMRQSTLFGSADPVYALALGWPPGGELRLA